MLNLDLGIMWQTYLQSLTGGALIGLAAALFLLLDGRIAGVSGIISGSLRAFSQTSLQNWAFVAGLVLGPILYLLLFGHWPAPAHRGEPLGAGARRPSCRFWRAAWLGLHQRSRRLRPSPSFAEIDRRCGDFPRRWRRHCRPDEFFRGPMSGLPKILVGLASGAIFGFGLSISGMLDPARVRGFLDVGGHFDPSLAFVLAGAVAVSAVGYLLSRRLAEASAWRGISNPVSKNHRSASGVGRGDFWRRLGHEWALSRPSDCLARAGTRSNLCFQRHDARRHPHLR